jgi:predicted dehydrogenase
VFVEKPLAIDRAGVDAVASAWNAGGAGGQSILMVGFNRRFSPLTMRMQALLATETAPKAVVITVNAGRIPAEHWTQDPSVGGGRILGEGCHFIDLARHLVQAPITGHDVRFVGPPGSDSAVISLGFEDGSCATIHYLSNGNRRVPKERVEIFTGGKILQLDNFRSLAGYGWPGFSRMGLWRQDKGQQECARAFLAATKGDGPPPIPQDEVFEVAQVSIDVATPGGTVAP